MKTFVVPTVTRADARKLISEVKIAENYAKKDAAAKVLRPLVERIAKDVKIELDKNDIANIAWKTANEFAPIHQWINLTDGTHHCYQYLKSANEPPTLFAQLVAPRKSMQNYAGRIEYQIRSNLAELKQLTLAEVE